MHASMWTLRQCSRSGELSFLKLNLKSIESETEKKPDPTGLLAGDKRALHRYARNSRGSVALYCASVCALCAAQCGACDRRGLARKSTGLEKRRRLKVSGRSPDTYIYIYIASDRIPSQHVGVGLAQARPKYLR